MTQQDSHFVKYIVLEHSIKPLCNYLTAFYQATPITNQKMGPKKYCHKNIKIDKGRSIYRSIAIPVLGVRVRSTLQSTHHHVTRASMLVCSSRTFAISSFRSFAISYFREHEKNRARNWFVALCLPCLRCVFCASRARKLAIVR